MEHDADMSIEEEKKKDEHGHGHSHDHADGHKSEVVAIGTITLGGATFAIDREGQIESGKTSTFGVERIAGPADVVPSAGWLANPDGTKVCEPVSGEGHLQHWHFTMTPLYPVKKSSFVLKVGEEEATIDYARGAEPCNDGILTVLKAAHDPVWRGYLELKLHGDAGDLELFLYAGFTGLTFATTKGGKPAPFDVPKETVVSLTFPSHEGRSLELRVRNDDKNEDEDGTPNMRAGGTNYFIFPGETGADPEWIKGEEFRGVVTVAFEADGKSYLTDPFILVPHEKL